MLFLITLCHFGQLLKSHILAEEKKKQQEGGQEKERSKPVSLPMEMKSIRTCALEKKQLRKDSDLEWH